MIRKVLDWAHHRLPTALQLSVVAGVEQYTAALSAWIFEDGPLADADPTMRELYLWHAAEEIEHKSVAFDLLHAVNPHYGVRLAGLVIAISTLFPVWALLTLGLIGQDRKTSRAEIRRDFWRALRGGDFPLRAIAKGTAAYLRPGFHPRQERNLHLAEEFFART